MLPFDLMDYVTGIENFKFVDWEETKTNEHGHFCHNFHRI